MAEQARKIKTKERTKRSADRINEVAARSNGVRRNSENLERTNTVPKKTQAKNKTTSDPEKPKQSDDSAYDLLFDHWDDEEFHPEDYMIDVPVDSLESAVGYSSLFRQMHQAFVRRVAFHKTPQGGSLSIEEARAKAFHACSDKAEAMKEFKMLMRQPLDGLNFVDLMELHSFAPRVAERFWESAKIEGHKEFASGHLSANISFPVGYLKPLWNIARYLGVRESFIEDWQPKGGIEMSLLDMLVQAYFQWQFWVEQTVRRSATKERELHPDYKRWMAQRKQELRVYGEKDGYWDRPYVTEQQAIEHAVQMADRWNRIYMRTLRQLRDLRRYTPVTINNPSQVNIASEGGRQVNVSNNDN